MPRVGSTRCDSVARCLGSSIIHSLDYLIPLFLLAIHLIIALAIWVSSGHSMTAASSKFFHFCLQITCLAQCWWWTRTKGCHHRCFHPRSEKLCFGAIRAVDASVISASWFYQIYYCRFINAFNDSYLWNSVLAIVIAEFSERRLCTSYKVRILFTQNVKMIDFSLSKSQLFA